MKDGQPIRYLKRGEQDVLPSNLPLVSCLTDAHKLVQADSAAWVDRSQPSSSNLLARTSISGLHSEKHSDRENLPNHVPGPSSSFKHRARRPYASKIQSSRVPCSLIWPLRLLKIRAFPSASPHVGSPFSWPVTHVCKEHLVS